MKNLKFTLAIIALFTLFLYDARKIDELQLQYIIITELGCLIAVMWVSDTMQRTRERVQERRDRLARAEKAAREKVTNHAHDEAVAVWEKNFSIDPDDLLIQEYLRTPNVYVFIGWNRKASYRQIEPMVDQYFQHYNIMGEPIDPKVDLTDLVRRFNK